MTINLQFGLGKTRIKEGKKNHKCMHILLDMIMIVER